MIDFFNSLDGFNKTMFFIFFATGIIFILQTISLFFGIGSDHDGINTDIDTDIDTDSDFDTDNDINHDHAQKDSGHSFGWFSFKNLINFLLIFSISGLISSQSGLSKLLSILIATASGIGFVFLMIFLFKQMKHLSQDNTPKLTDLIGEIGTVYLKIEAGGKGKIKIIHGGTTMYLDAISENSEIPTDANIRVIKILGHSIVVEQIF